MPDDDYDQDEQDSPVMSELRSKLKAAEKDANEATALRTENAILKAGLGDLSDRQRKAILATHEGDLTPEALKATAEDLGFTKVQEEAPQVPADEQAAHQRVAEATAGAESSEATKTTLIDEINATDTPEALSALLAREQILLTE